MALGADMDSEIDRLLHRYAMDSLRQSKEKLRQLEELKRGVRAMQQKVSEESRDLERRRAATMARLTWLEDYDETAHIMQRMVAATQPEHITAVYLEQVFGSLQVRDARHRLAIAIKVAKGTPYGAMVLRAAAGYLRACTSFSSRDLVIEFYSASAECELGAPNCDNGSVDAFLSKAAEVALNHAQLLRGLGRASECEYYSKLCCGYLDLRTRHAHLVDRPVSADQRVRCLAEAMMAHKTPVTPLNRSALSVSWGDSPVVDATLMRPRRLHEYAIENDSPHSSESSGVSSSRSPVSSPSDVKVRTVSLAAQTCNWGAIGFASPPSAAVPFFRTASMSPSCSLAGSLRSPMTTTPFANIPHATSFRTAPARPTEAPGYKHPTPPTHPCPAPPARRTHQDTPPIKTPPMPPAVPNAAPHTPQGSSTPAMPTLGTHATPPAVPSTPPVHSSALPTVPALPML
eukprot:TRINITY_DN25037_c0_g1_i1.p1 TRINITY_DN25037_c0_g1~~TRINITY_DN25037_c0_g1_i1.p1  ORF type:complete len:459 (+),score=82.44 TRINITY_DN25037_c0_g1_i1:47-1423(+)